MTHTEIVTEAVHIIEEADSILDTLTSHEDVCGTSVEHAIAGVRRLLQVSTVGLRNMGEVQR